MKTLKPEILAKQYGIPVTAEQVLAIDSYDMECFDDYTAMSVRLEKECNAILVDYNGHFGAFIFLTLETADDTPENWNAIELIIEEASAISIPYYRAR